MSRINTKEIYAFIYVIAAIIGGYVFTWGFVSLGVTALVYLGVDFHTAELGMFMLAIIIYTFIFLWFFSLKSRFLGWLTLFGGGALMTLAGYSLQTILLA